MTTMEALITAALERGEPLSPTLKSWLTWSDGIVFPSPDDLRRLAEVHDLPVGDVVATLGHSIQQGPTPAQLQGLRDHQRTERDAALQDMVAAGEITQAEARRAMRRDAD